MKLKEAEEFKKTEAFDQDLPRGRLAPPCSVGWMQQTSMSRRAEVNSNPIAVGLPYAPYRQRAFSPETHIAETQTCKYLTYVCMNLA